jgi:hypothetical protein
MAYVYVYVWYGTAGSSSAAHGARPPTLTSQHVMTVVLAVLPALVLFRFVKLAPV